MRCTKHGWKGDTVVSYVLALDASSELAEERVTRNGTEHVGNQPLNSKGWTAGKSWGPWAPV
jgi:hypothetical protein